MEEIKKTRVDILLELIKKSRTWDESVFDKLVPHRYGELYSLYNILSRAEALSDVKFKTPSFDGGNMTITMNLPKKTRDKILAYLSEKKFVVKYLKSDEFTVTTNQTDGGIQFTFTRTET